MPQNPVGENSDSADESGVPTGENEAEVGGSEEMAGENDESAATHSAYKVPTPDKPDTKFQLSGMFQNWFLDYASYVILERAVPHLSDGLKPVQRRILHAMKLLDDGRFNKVANIVGHTMQFHPHGDASIGDALVQLGQKDLLVECQGNWGNILTGDSAAAPRYIEARLSKFALDVVFNPKTTEWKLSYDGRKKEPVTLPVKFPLLLAQGAEGIAVGLSSKILPHNFNEILEAAVVYLRGEEFHLYPDFQDNFIISKKHGIESVVSINYGAPDLWKSQFNVSLLPAEIRQYSPGGNEGPSNANSWIVPTEELYNSFAEGDVRRDVTIMKDFTYSDGSTLVFAESARYPYYFCKYWDREAEPMGQNSEQNYPYMRYSEVLLMYAEALNEVNDGPTTEAYEAINKVRDRAFKDNGSGEHDLKNLDYKEFRKAILDERRWELVLEGSRWFDLVRLSTDFAAEIKRTKPDSYVEEKHKLYPIPQYERLLNDRITQNDGY